MQRTHSSRRPGRERRWTASIAPAGAACALALTTIAADGYAQNRDRPPNWAGDAAFASANALLGGVTAGLFHSLRGGDFWPAFRTGIVGGGLAYGGRRIAAERFGGAGIIGRELAALGTSMVANASEGRGAVQQIVLPVALGRLYLDSDSTFHIRFKLDVPTTAATVYFALRSDSDFDVRATLSSGLPVFITHVRYADGYWSGYQTAGVIRLTGNPNDPAPDAEKSAVLAHERVHVLQYDFTLLTWSSPAEAWLAMQHPLGSWAHRNLDLGLQLLPWQLANWLVPHRARPWEHEAHFLSRVSSERD